MLAKIYMIVSYTFLVVTLMTLIISIYIIISKV